MGKNVIRWKNIVEIVLGTRSDNIWVIRNEKKYCMKIIRNKHVIHKRQLWVSQSQRKSKSLTLLRGRTGMPRQMVVQFLPNSTSYDSDDSKFSTVAPFWSFVCTKMVRELSLSCLRPMVCMGVNQASQADWLFDLCMTKKYSGGSYSWNWVADRAARKGYIMGNHFKCIRISWAGEPDLSLCPFMLSKFYNPILGLGYSPWVNGECGKTIF